MSDHNTTPSVNVDSTFTPQHGVWVCTVYKPGFLPDEVEETCVAASWADGLVNLADNVNHTERLHFVEEADNEDASIKAQMAKAEDGKSVYVDAYGWRHAMEFQPFKSDGVDEMAEEVVSLARAIANRRDGNTLSDAIGANNRDSDDLYSKAFAATFGRVPTLCVDVEKGHATEAQYDDDLRIWNAAVERAESAFFGDRDSVIERAKLEAAPEDHDNWIVEDRAGWTRFWDNKRATLTTSGGWNRAYARAYAIGWAQSLADTAAGVEGVNPYDRFSCAGEAWACGHDDSYRCHPPQGSTDPERVARRLEDVRKGAR